MTTNYGDVKGSNEELVRAASYTPFLSLTVKISLGVYSDRHERTIAKRKAARVNIIASCCDSPKYEDVKGGSETEATPQATGRGLRFPRHLQAFYE